MLWSLPCSAQPRRRAPARINRKRPPLGRFQIGHDYKRVVASDVSRAAPMTFDYGDATAEKFSSC